MRGKSIPGNQFCIGALVSVDENDRIVGWSAAAERVLGFTRGEALGRSSRELLGSALAGGRSRDPVETSLRTKQGRRQKLLVTPVVGRGEPNVPEDSGLSEREREILSLLARGLGTDELAKRLFISPVTVRNHTQNILRKLGVHSRLQAVIWAYVNRVV